MYKRILLAVDGSEHSLRAAEEAMKLGGSTTNCIIDAVHVVEFSKSKTEILHAQSQEELELKRREQLQPVEKLLTQGKIMCRLEIIHGEAASAIIEYADKENVDLIILGSRGLNVVQEMVLGSVSHKVLKLAPCPVVIVK
ncbi:universal stress protein [Paenibacillus polymyxa]|uniref:universal stress protein n=1 Tax=Paenibacillus polymyxa TaxID=1406 RepID=UPI001BECA0A4|nr:universal stress protein [Paenibacillus polymyxa]MBT2285301.1 universal stress protein [Paenibacillus polymyxa]